MVLCDSVEKMSHLPLRPQAGQTGVLRLLWIEQKSIRQLVPRAMAVWTRTAGSHVLGLAIPPV